MSGIYGFSLLQPPAASLADTLAGLEYWNRIYGRDAGEQAIFGESGIGCHIEHFSDRFSYGGPVLHFEGGYAVVDALLYNRDELLPLAQMAADDPISDEALLLKLFLAHGSDALAAVNGDFCGAVYLTSERKWFLFRDHLGVRPLYYYCRDGIFVFSTDIRGIASVDGVDLRVNREKFFARLNFCSPLSLSQSDYEHIQCILPASVTQVCISADGFSVTQKPYWKLRSRKIRLKQDEDYARKMRQLVEDSVRRRLEAVPGLIGAELSGGLDSGVIDILINRNGRKGCYYSWSPDPATFPLVEKDERRVIADICRQEGIECRYIHADDIACSRDLYLRVVPSFVNTLELSYGSRWMHQQGARVIFTGHGGDEGVSHRASRFELLYNGEILSYLKLYHEDLKGRSFAILKTVYAACVEAFRRWRSIGAPLHPTDLRSCILDRAFNDEMIHAFRNEPLYFSLKPWRYVMQGGTRGRLDNVAYQGAAAGVRYLVPFVDHRVMDFAVSVPRRLYISNTGNRMLYRQAFRDLMPRSLADVDYKDFLSLDSKKQTPDPDKLRKIHRDNRTFFLEHLDCDYWKGILDLDAIASWERPETSDADTLRRFYYETAELDRCILIQNTALMAKNWRDIDENPDLL